MTQTSLQTATTRRPRSRMRSSRLATDVQIPVDQRFNLRGKVAAVIGGAGYLCSALAQAMLESGMQVAILDIAEAKTPTPPRAAARMVRLRCDVSSRKALVHCRDEMLQRYGRVDVLLNGAGTNAPTPFFEITQEEFEQIIGVNLLGTLLGCQVFGETMVRQRAGSIINVTSVSMGPPLSKAFVYSTAKAGVAKDQAAHRQ